MELADLALAFPDFRPSVWRAAVLVGRAQGPLSAVCFVKCIIPEIPLDISGFGGIVQLLHLSIRQVGFDVEPFGRKSILPAGPNHGFPCGTHLRRKTVG